MELRGNLSSLRAFGEWYGARFAVLHSPYLIVACGCALALLCLYVLIVGEPPRESKPALHRAVRGRDEVRDGLRLALLLHLQEERGA